MFDYDRIAESMQKITDFVIRFLKKAETIAGSIADTTSKQKHKIESVTNRGKTKVKAIRPSFAVYLLCSLGMAVFSSFSLCLFHHMRTAEGVEAYYQNSSLSLTQDILHTQVPLLYLLILFLTLLFFIAFRLGLMRGLASKLTAAPLAFNMIVSLSMEHSDLRQIFLPNDARIGAFLLNLIAFIGFDCILSVGIGLVFRLIDKKEYRPSFSENGKLKSVHLFWSAFFFIFIGWIPSMIMCYPGGLAQDTLWQIQSFMGEKPLDASHPALTTVFYGWLFSLGRKFGSDNSSLFKITLIQSVVNAISMALVCSRTYKYTKSKAFFIISILFFGYTPVWGMTAVKAMKDVIHTGWYLLFYLEFLNCVEKDKLTKGDIAWMCFCSIMVAFTRKATFYLAVLCIIVLILKSGKKYYLSFGICLAIVVALFMGCNKFLFPLMKFRPEKERENYSMQFQQVALYCREYGDEMTEDEIRIINGTLNFNTIVEKYTPMISDDVKATYHGTAEDHKEFWDLYFKLIRKHPGLFLKGMIMTSFEHINPWYDHNFTGAIYISKNNSFHNIEFASGKNLSKIQNYWKSWSKYPIARLMCGNGLPAWILIIMLGYSIKSRSLLSVIGLAPHLFLLIGLFMSHVNGLIRYGYPLVAATPLIIAFTVYVSSKKRSLPEAVEDVHKQENLHSHTPQWLKTFGDPVDSDGYYKI